MRRGLWLVFAVACGGEAREVQTPADKPVRRDPGWLAAASEGCEKIASCTQSKDPGRCVDGWLAQPDSMRKCVVDAKSCVEVDSCLSGAGDARAAAFCRKPGVLAGCDGERLVSCGESEATVTDCAALGAKCSEQKQSGVIVRACFSPDKCPASAPENRCEGDDAVISCHDGAIERTSCGTGTRCRERTDPNGDSTASCVLASGSCVRGCDGDRLVDCPKGRAAITDCAAEGLHCEGNGPRAACVVRDVECDHEQLPSCEGADVALCAAGRLVRVSCDRIGMSRCSSQGGALAACSPKTGP